MAVAGHAETALIVLSDDSSLYQQTANAIESELPGRHKVVKVLSDRLGDALSDADMVIAVGTKASEQTAARAGKNPFLSVMVSRDWYQKVGRSLLAESGRNSAAIVLDQPYSRQLRLIKAAFPQAARVGVVASKENAYHLPELDNAARPLRLSINDTIVDSESDLVGALNKTLSSSDVLLTMPDAVVLNRNTVQSLFITAYRHRDPVIGYSKALTRAGALVSLYSSPEQLGKQAGEMANRMLSGSRYSGVQWPKYYSLSINAQVARSLDMNISPEEDLLAKLQEGEGD